MSRREVAAFLPVGVNLDLAPFAAGPEVYTRARNMSTNGDGMTRSGGVERVYVDHETPPQFAMSVVVAGEVWLLYMSGDKVFATDGATHHDVTPAAGWVPWDTGTMTAGLYNGVAVFAHPKAPPWYWDGLRVVGSVKPLPGWLAGGDSCNAIAPYGSHVFAGGIGTSPGRLAWSDIAPPGSVPASWVPTATNQAGDIDLSTGAGSIMCMASLAGSLMVYRISGMWALQYVGRPYIYVGRKVSSEVGAASHNAVVEVRGGHVVLAPDDLIFTDGVTTRSIGHERVKSSLFGRISETGQRLSHVYATPGAGEVVFCLALGNDEACNTAYVWDYELDRWSVRDLPQVAHSFASVAPATEEGTTWDNDPGPWNDDDRPWDQSTQQGFAPRSLAVSAVNDAIYLLDSGDLGPDGEPVQGELERLSLPIGDGVRVQFISHLHPRIEATPGTVVDVQVGVQLTAADQVLWGASQPYVVGRSRRVDVRRLGRYVSVRFTGSDRSVWGVSGFAVEAQPRGVV